jgi:hypothetical protein
MRLVFLKMAEGPEHAVEINSIYEACPESKDTSRVGR